MIRPPDDPGGDLASQTNDPRDQTIGSLVARLVDDGKAYARAEIEVVKQVARHRANKARIGIALLGVGIVLLLCALQALVLALVLGLATLIGPFGAGMAVFALLALAGALGAKAGVKALSAIGGDPAEKAALGRDEVQP